MPSAALRFTSPFPRSRVSGHAGTSESPNDQSVSRARAVSGPVATVRPLSRPAKGSVSRNGRTNSRSKSRASRSASRSATSPESATLRAGTRPSTAPPAYASRRESTPTSSHPAAVRAYPHVSREHTRRGRSPEAAIDEGEIAERRRVGTQPEIEQHRTARPADGAADVAQRGRGQLRAGQLHLHRVADHAQPARDVDEPHLRVGALEGEPGHVDANPALAWRRDLQRGQVGVQMLEAPYPQPAVRAAGGDLQRRITGFGVARLQSQRHTAVGDPDVPQQDERRDRKSTR